MCLLCLEIQKQNMSPREVARAFSEIVMDDHAEEVAELIAENEEFFDEVREELVALRARD